MPIQSSDLLHLRKLPDSNAVIVITMGADYFVCVFGKFQAAHLRPRVD